MNNDGEMNTTNVITRATVGTRKHTWRSAGAKCTKRRRCHCVTKILLKTIRRSTVKQKKFFFRR